MTVKKIVAASAAIALSTVGTVTAAASTASATPSKDISAVTLAEAEIPEGLLPFVPEGVHVVARQITIAPGGTTGWHYHQGPVLGIVLAGTLTHPGPDCIPDVYPTGALIDERAGADNTHIGRNLGTVPVVLAVVYLEPVGAPLFVDAPAPACDMP